MTGSPNTPDIPDTPSTSSSLSNKQPAEVFDRALQLLDHELTGLELDQPIQIRAIGGYALLKHGVREDDQALTADIDTMTRDYSAGVQQAIREVARKTGLDTDWINNDNLGGNDPEDIEAIYDATWERQNTGLKNILVSIASIPTLTRAKIIAADTAAFSGRAQDAPDLLRLLDHQGITTYAQFQSRYPDPFEEHPDTSSLVRGHLGGRAAGALDSDRMRQLKSEISAAAEDLDYGDDEYDLDDDYPGY